jgi:peroxiredoxin
VCGRERKRRKKANESSNMRLQTVAKELNVAQKLSCQEGVKAVAHLSTTSAHKTTTFVNNY